MLSALPHFAMCVVLCSCADEARRSKPEVNRADRLALTWSVISETRHSGPSEASSARGWAAVRCRPMQADAGEWRSVASRELDVDVMRENVQ